ncbi:MAG TPA: ATP-binding protein, partial [Opitutus sp.]|nr:ATP-binding protein [Opitutus sp.]
MTAIRRSLGGVEAAADHGSPEAAHAPHIVALFRAVHSLKGIAAIAGVKAAEELAHATEDLLRALSGRAVPFTRERRELLIDAAQRLEALIGQHRAGKTLSGSADFTARLRRAAQPGERREAGDASAPAKVPTRAPDGDLVAKAQARGLELWRCTFAPTAELDRRGVNVSQVRERLGGEGEILSSVPAVLPNGGIQFVFFVGFRAPPADCVAWAADGLQCERVIAPAADPDTAPSAPTDERSEVFSLMPSHLVRVDLSRLDELMRIAGELVIQRSRLADRIQRERGADEALKEIDHGLARSLRDLRKAITRVRLVPIAEIFTRMPLVIRDLAAESPKRARVVLEGNQTEIDKYLAERLKEPLLHLVRNAFSHGVETTSERRAAGKPEEATITLRAEGLGESVLIQVRDDGCGVDDQAVIARARSLGMPAPDEVDSRGLLAILCAPGFSTREQADRVAGRGVGMAVVANTVRELGGTLALSTNAGVGTEFTLRLPLTLSITDAIIVTAGAETCAVPQGAVEELFQIEEVVARRIKDAEVVPYRDGLLPLVRLRAIFGLTASAQASITVLVLNSERGAVGLVVDRVISRREIVVRPL